MAEKEPIGLGNGNSGAAANGGFPEKHQKANLSMFPSPPSLTSMNNAKVSQENQPSLPGYYQKGKLILPTALWILLVIAGLCFLSLLASLNKTMHTLDVLVELEQEDRDKFDREYEKLKSDFKFNDASRQLPSRVEPLRADSSSVELADKSWLSFPSWASLEPAKKMNKNKKPIDELDSLIDNMLKSSDAIDGGKLTPIGGSIIISGSLSGDEAEEFASSLTGNKKHQGDNLIKSMLDEVFGKQQRPKPKEDREQPLITANIDKINVNINSTPETRSKKVKSSLNNQRQRDEQELINSIDKSIDSLMMNLMEPGNDKHSDMLFPLLSAPSIRPLGHDHKAKSPLSPLASLLEPLDLLHYRDNDRKQPSQKPPKTLGDFIAPPMFGRPKKTESPTFIVVESNKPNEHNELDSIISMLTGATKASNKLDKFEPPYQTDKAMDTLVPVNKPLESKSDLSPDHQSISDEQLISSIAQSILPAKQQESTQEAAKPANQQEDDFDGILLVNGQPLIGEKKQSIAREEDLVKQNDIKDLFQMFFGKPPQSVEPTVVLKNEIPSIPTSPAPANSAVPESIVTNNVTSDIESMLKPMNMIVVDGGKEADKRPTSSESQPVSGPASTSFDNLFGSFFSLPQFGKDDQVIHVEAQSKDPKGELSTISATAALR